MSANPRITHNPYGYTGREMDTLRLYYYRARYYSPILHRFLTPDPIEHDSGDWNWYRYVGNDPVNRVDPSGLYVDPRLAGAGVPAAMGGRKFSPPIPYGSFGGQCGTEGSPWATWLPDLTESACEQHDKCYSTCGKSKMECDLIFLFWSPIYGAAVIASPASQNAYSKAQKHCTEGCGSW